MRHRIINAITGLGNSDVCELSNNFDFQALPFYEELAEDLIKNFSLFGEYQGFDFNLEDDIVAFGIEPAYEGEKLEIVGFNLRNKKLCFWKKGIARGAYGSQICASIRVYDMYKRKSKFVKFIDKWFDKLSEALGG